jgi:hypoxanthine phosphoribosyltransferase
MKKTLTFEGNYKSILLLDERQIQRRIKALAKVIDRDYHGTVPVFLSILNGAFIFTSDLLKNLTIDCEVEFLKLSSYANSTTSSGKVELITPIPRSIRNRDVIVVEDIIDSGNTVRFLQKGLKRYNLRSLKIISLLYKNQKAPKDVKIDYIGFRIPNHFVVGYGLDLMQKKRHLKNIYRLIEENKP